MSISSQPHHREAFLGMVLAIGGAFKDYYVLRIWDGRYAAFWREGFEIEHCIAVAEHITHEEYGSTWPFAFISENMEEVERYINDPKNGSGIVGGALAKKRIRELKKQLFERQKEKF